MFRSLTLLAAIVFAFAAISAQMPVDRPLLIGRVALNQTHIASVAHRSRRT
jgi:hypothetical protein